MPADFWNPQKHRAEKTTKKEKKEHTCHLPRLDSTVDLLGIDVSMDTAGLKALQTLGDAGHFSIFHHMRKDLPHMMKYTARSADAWCASALFPTGYWQNQAI